MTIDIKELSENVDKLIADWDAREAKRIAAMTPKERAVYDRDESEKKAYYDWLCEKAVTREELQQLESHLTKKIDERNQIVDELSQTVVDEHKQVSSLRDYQSGTDRNRDRLKAENDRLKAENAKGFWFIKQLQARIAELERDK